MMMMMMITTTTTTTSPYYLGPCHHGVARPRIADTGDGLQIWRVTANILNKQSHTADKGWSSSSGLDERLTTHHRKKQLVTKCYTGLRKWGALVNTVMDILVP
jgi:hypothetical protein